MKHIHHILPKHMGGTDEESNLVELTIEEHAEAHKKLYEEHGHWQDYLAWKGLSGMISKEKLIAKMLSEGGKKGGKNKPSSETKEKISKKVSGKRNGMFNHNFSNEHRNKLRNSKIGTKLSSDHKKRISETLSGTTKPKIECPHCGKLAASHVVYRYHFSNCKAIRNNTVL